MKHLFTVAMLCAPLALLAQPNNPVIQEFEAEKLFQKGKELYRRADFNGATAYFNQVENLLPTHPQVYELRAEAYFKLKDYLQAIEDYEVAIERHPENPELYNSAGVAAAKIGQYRAAFQYFDQALAIDPNHPGARKNRQILQQQYSSSYDYDDPTEVDEDVFDPNKETEEEAIIIMDLNAEAIGRGSSATQESKLVETSDRDFEGQNAYTYYATRDQIKVGGQNDPYIEILRITLQENSTDVAFMVSNVNGDDYPLLLERNDPRHTFYITDANFERTYRLRGVRGLEGWRQGRPYRMQAGQQKTFVATFDALPKNLHTFHLLEGTEPREGAFNFWNVALKLNP